MPVRRLVIKVGTQVLISPENGVNQEAIQKVASAVLALRKSKLEVVLVSSGAVGLGRVALGLKPPLTLAEKQACAAVGQGRLMRMYDEKLGEHKQRVGQILVTTRDFSDRTSYLRLKDTFETLMHLGAVPVVNENDSVSIAELKENEQHSFGDNDKLSSIVAIKTQADLLVLVSSVDGVYDSDPTKNPKAQRIPTIEKLEDFAKINSSGGSELGRGGMSAKLEASRAAALNGIPTFITDLKGLELVSAIHRDFAIEALKDGGTLIHPAPQLRGKKKWIGTSSGYKATITINAGAINALVERNASLLAVGVSDVQGEFGVGDVLSIRGEDGAEIARGLARLSSEETAQKANGKILVHRDDLALLVSRTEEP